jgi:hypothetical protein
MPTTSKMVNSWDLITNNKMSTLILFGLIISGIFIKLFLSGGDGSANNGQASSTIWGYGLTTVSLFTLMFIIISKSLNESNESAFSLIISRGFPILSLVVILIYIITINLSYFQIINQNLVPSEFNLYSTISSILIIFQILILFQGSRILLQGEDGNQNMLSRIINITWIFSILNLILGVIMNIILKFFTTDG